MANDLVSPDDLSGFPGAPFTDGAVDAAVASLRAMAGWHIAPSRTETLTLDSDGGTRAVLPSLHVTAVSAVRNAYSSTPTDITDFRWSAAGVLSRWGRWPLGFQSLEVDLTHGYEECPPDLLPVIVSLVQAGGTDVTVAQQSAGPFSVTTTNLSTLSAWLDRAGSALSRYTLPSRP